MKSKQADERRSRQAGMEREMEIGKQSVEKRQADKQQQRGVYQARKGKQASQPANTDRAGTREDD